MSGLANLFAIAALASTSAAFAAPTHLSDSQYLAAAHCQGLYDSRSLGAADASGINARHTNDGCNAWPRAHVRAVPLRPTRNIRVRQANNKAAMRVVGV